MEQMRERVAREIAPFLEGGREFDQMPVNRLQLREWARQAMCGFNDATQDDAYEAADAALSLMQPEIDRRVAEEKAKLLERFDEDELEQIISNSLDMDWLPRDAARAIRQAMLAAFQQENSDGR